MPPSDRRETRPKILWITSQSSKSKSEEKGGVDVIAGGERSAAAASPAPTVATTISGSNESSLGYPPLKRSRSLLVDDVSEQRFDDQDAIEVNEWKTFIFLVRFESYLPRDYSLLY